ncbi:MAG: ISAs1 family transposase, partial [Dehalococcoidia bacterium]|nr:ISAs1 family transposase [Dehalococcoidia bacterium]
MRGYRRKKGDYLFVVKDNQPTLRQDIEDLWDGVPLPTADVSKTNKHGDRIEQRSLWASDELVGYSDWPHMAQVYRLERIVTRKGETTREVAYGVTSLSHRKAGPQRLLTLSRGHWGIENRTHWVRDVTFDEDRCQIRTGAAPQVMAALRNMAISLLRLARKPNIAEALRRNAAHPHEALALV